MNTTETRFDTAVIESEVSNLNNYIEQLEALSSKIEQVNLQSGWDSRIVQTNIIPKLETIKEDIRQMRECVIRIHANVNTFKSGIVAADESGTRQSAA